MVPGRQLEFHRPADHPVGFRLETTPVQPVEVRQLNDGVFYDFGRELMAFVKGTQVTGKGTVHISYGESDTEALDVEGCEAFDELEVHGDFIAPQTRAFRYIFVADRRRPRHRAH